MTPDPLPGVLAQLTAHHEQITQLDTRETSHHAAVTERLTQITDLITGIRRLLDDHQAALARLEGPGGRGGAAHARSADSTGHMPVITWPTGTTPRRHIHRVFRSLVR